MKALLVAVNAKYIHTSLSVRTLKAYANSDNVEMAEYTINERVEDILRSIFLKKRTWFCFRAIFGMLRSVLMLPIC